MRHAARTRALVLGVALSSFACGKVLGLRDGKPIPDTCSETSECGPNQACSGGRCVSMCKSSDACAEGEACVAGVCQRAAPVCKESARRCSGLEPETCASGTWQSDGPACTTGCTGGRCVTPPSCDFDPKCGSGSSCCEQRAVPGGTFELMQADPGSRASTSVARKVGPFALDRFEVTVARFRHFLDGYSSSNFPVAGAGEHPRIPGTGWNEEWNYDREKMPPNADSLEQALEGCGALTPDTPSDAPIQCVTWYVAFAFCIWDGGRLPTEAEWTFAASGGDEQRIYPWSTSDRDTSIDASDACYSTSTVRTGPDPVGRHPEGAGKFGHEDLSGNVAEWVQDYWRVQLAECGAGSADAGADGVVECVEAALQCCRGERGGAFDMGSLLLENTRRTGDLPTRRSPDVGFRCAYDPT